MQPPPRTWPPVLQLLLDQPQRVVEHASAYAALAADEGAEAWARLSRQLLLKLVIGCAAMAAVMLAGVALMLWATLPPGADRSVWPLIAVPLAPMLIALWAWLAHQRDANTASFARFREQVGLDAAALRNWGDDDLPTR